MIRRDVIEYLDEEMYQFALYPRPGKDWWSKFYQLLFNWFKNLGILEDKDIIRSHIEKAVTPATGPGDKDRWMNNLDMAATAKMFKINVIVCEKLRENMFRWQFYSPKLEHSVSLTYIKNLFCFI